MEFSGYDSSIRPERLKLLTDGAAPFLQESSSAEPHESWFGWRPMTWDGLPIISRCPGLENVIVAAGHNMLGLSMAPATGEMVAGLLSKQSPVIDPQPYSLERFL
jgi:D-amino-acid dehydrogenase